MPRSRQQGRPVGDRLLTYGLLPGAGTTIPGRGHDWFVDTFNGYENAPGTSWAKATKTMQAAIDKAETHDRIFFVGDVREEIVASNLKFDISIIGCGSLHHPDQPSSVYDPAASMWRPPSSPTAATPLLELRGRGWTFENIVFDCPVDAAAVELVRNSSSGTDEYDASHATFKSCLFRQGKYGIEDNGGCHNVIVEDCEFFLISEASGVAIYNSSSSVALPLKWTIRGCNFPADGAAGGNETHIDTPLTSSLITGSYFGTVEGSGLYIDLTGGSANIVVDNYLMGSYSTDDYVAGTGDMWVGNTSIDTDETEVEADGTTNTTPQA